jgi:hypothetical protein
MYKSTIAFRLLEQMTIVVQKMRLTLSAQIAAILMLAAVFLSSCENSGQTTQQLQGSENDLPEELKGLKVYRVSTGGISYVYVAVLDGKINSTNYQVGKTQQSTIIIDKSTGKQIEVSQILSENDSVIVCRK